MATRRWLDVNGDWNNTANWSGGAVPVNGDDVYIEEGANNIVTNLNQSAVALNSLHIAKNFESNIGSYSQAAGNTYLQIGATTVNLGYIKGSTTPSGSARLNLDLGSATAATVTVFDTSSTSDDSGQQPLRLLAVNATTDIEVRAGLVGIANAPGEASTIRNLDVLGLGNTLVRLGEIGNNSAMTITAGTVTVKNGTLITNNDITALVAEGGLVQTEGDAALTTLTMKGADAILNASGTIGTLNMHQGIADFSQSSRAITVTNMDWEELGGQVIFDNDDVTFTNINYNFTNIATWSIG